jgi:Ser/Thr protein kinase RdoA (MazF antagonist)
VPIPNFLAHIEESNRHWLLLEVIPLPLQAENGPAFDDRALRILLRLHEATRDWRVDAAEAADWTWTEARTEAALSRFIPPIARRLRPMLRRLQPQAARLSRPWCWICGDASLPNWGVRADGGLVLFDWELFRPGLPAADLAPAVSGLGDSTAFRRCAAAYSEFAPFDLPWTIEDLAQDIALAKVTTVVMMLAAAATGRAQVPAETVRFLTDAVPDWLPRLGF